MTTVSEVENLKEFLAGGRSIPNDYPSGPLKSTIDELLEEGKSLIEDSYSKGEPFSISKKRKAALMIAYARDLDSGAAGDKTLRGQGFNNRLRAAYEEGRGLADNP